MKTLLAAAVLAAVTVSVAGCGGSDGDSDSAAADSTAAQAISDSIVKEQKTPGSPAALLSITSKQADCIGDGLVDEIGRKKLQKYGALTADNRPKGKVTEIAMSPADATKATDVLFGCADVEAMVEKAIAATAAVDRSMRACVNDAINDENLHTMFTQVFEGKPYVARRSLLGPITQCAVGKGG